MHQQPMWGLLSDDSALDDVISEVLGRSDEYRRLSRRVRGAQDALQRAVGRKPWLLYLRLEEIVNDRVAFETRLIARWALRHARAAARMPKRRARQT
jgi:hypothetical protein